MVSMLARLVEYFPLDGCSIISYSVITKQIFVPNDKVQFNVCTNR